MPALGCLVRKRGRFGVGEFHSAKQLRVCGDNERGQTHRDRAHVRSANFGGLVVANELTLRAAALKLGFVTEAEFDRVVDPRKMVKAYVASA